MVKTAKSHYQAFLAYFFPSFSGFNKIEEAEEM